MTGIVLTDKKDSQGDVFDITGVSFNKEIPVTIGYSEDHVDKVGVARLKKNKKSVSAKVKIYNTTRLPKDLAKMALPAIGGRIIKTTRTDNGNIINKCEITELTITTYNADRSIKPLKIKESKDE